MSKFSQTKSKVVDRAIRNDNFRQWFGNSKVVDENGEPLIVYRGDFDVEDLGSEFDKDKTTSGRFYFTDDPTVASGYTNKGYVSDEQIDYAKWFKVKAPNGNFYTLDEVWKHLSGKDKIHIIKKAREVNINDNGITDHSDGKLPADQVDYYAKRETQRDYVRALVEVFLASGALFIDWGDSGDEDAETFIKILEYVGFDHIKYKNPRKGQGGVTPVFLSIQNPLDTSTDVDAFFYDELYDQTEDWDEQEIGVDSWDKTSVSKDGWFKALKKDIENNETMTWITIPENVTKALQELGYDGIKDDGGKYNSDGNRHVVWIAFEPEQIKSIYNTGNWNPQSKNITERKLLREFDEHDEQFMDEAFTTYDELKRFIESIDTDTLKKMINHPYRNDRDVLKMLITPKIYKFSAGDDLYIGFGEWLEGWLMALSVGDNQDAIILFNYADIPKDNKNIVEYLLDVIKTYKHGFVHEFAHYKQHTKGEALYTTSSQEKITNDDVGIYFNNKSELEAYLKEMFAWTFEHLQLISKKHEKEFVDYVTHLSDEGFINYIRANLEDFDIFIKHLTPENLKMVQDKTRKFKKYLQTKF